MTGKKSEIEILRNSLDTLSYPEYVLKLKEIGVQRFVMNIGNHDLHFVFKTDEIVNIPGDEFSIENENPFNLKDTALCVSEFHEGLTTYPEFLLALANSGVHRYIADLENMEAIYVGLQDGETYTEQIPEFRIKNT